MVIEIGRRIPRSLNMVKPRRWASSVAVVLALLLAGMIAALWKIPWQQSVTGVGEVIIFNPMERPQNIEAQIPGRLVAWDIVEGASVQKGQTIAVLEDIDSKFLDPQQPARIRKQRLALLDRLRAAQMRAAKMGGQIAALGRSRNAAVPSAQERAKQAENRRQAAQQAVLAARQSLKVARDVAQAAANERLRQAEERIKIAEQTLEAAEANKTVAGINYGRLERLTKRGLRAGRDFELATAEKVRTETEVERAKNALEVAKRDRNVGSLAQSQAEFEAVRAAAELGRVQAVLDEAVRGTTVGDLDARRTEADTSATISSAEASLASVQETIASIQSDLQKLDVEYSNVVQRTGQRKVLAPDTGRIVRLTKVGTGETVKAGDVLAVLAPDGGEQMVELYLSDNDAPFVFPGAPARLQFAGWPAITWVGFPSAAVGTFAGRVKFMDAIDDGKARYRVIIAPDYEAIKAGKEAPWPTPNPQNPNGSMTLRPGAEVNGWVLLREVPLYFELWRNLNAFPPTIDSKAPKSKLGKDKDEVVEEKAKEEKIKRKIKLPK